MAESNDLIDFNVIESHKENIQALPSGRSAKALAQLYSPPLLGAQPSPSNLSPAQLKARAEFEQELATIDEADDPLDVYDRYVKWTLDAFPSAQATPQSQLLPLLERATKAFQSSAHYQNDPRYLKIWLHYIRLFSDAPREAFVFLARHGIGEMLALYYEEFAAWLENAGRWNQAEEIYQMGLEREARPAERLTRKFGEFARRKEAQPPSAAEPSSPALPTVRPALAAKVDPFSASSSPEQSQSQGSGGSKKLKGSKMAIFSDSDAPSRPSSGSESQGWDSIGSLASRRKENSMEARPMAGEKLKVGKTNGGMQKMMVFKDQLSSSFSHRTMPKHLSRDSPSSNHEQQCVLNEKTGRLECVFVNLEAVYPEAGNLSVEFCFEELRARHRGWLNKDWRKEKAAKKQASANGNNSNNKNHSFGIQRDDPLLMEQLAKSTDEPPAPTPPPSVAAPPKQKPKERGFQIFEDAPLNTEGERRKRTGKEEKRIQVESSSKTLALNDENDENTPPSKQQQQQQQDVDLAKKAARREERANRTRKIKVMDTKHIKNETQTIQLKMDSPQGSKPKRKKSLGPPAAAAAEPTMTINTKEAMDEIYGIFSAPLPSHEEQQADEEEGDSDSSGDDDDDETDYTTGDESTATGKLSVAASEYGDETRNELLAGSKSAHHSDEDDDDDGGDRTNVTGWSDFTTSKHVPKEENEGDSVESTTDDVYDSTQTATQTGEEDVTTPVGGEEEDPRTRYVPMAAEEYESAAARPRVGGQFRDMSGVPNHRLPFMTPIVEQTESSLGVATVRTEQQRQDYFGGAAKTPSRKTGAAAATGGEHDAEEEEEDEDEEGEDSCSSSPFRDTTMAADRAEDKRRVLQPIRTKSTKGTLALGQGTAKVQAEKKEDQKRRGAAAVDGVTAAVTSTQKGPIITDAQCNPMDPHLRQTILARMALPLSAYEGYHERLDAASGRSAEIRKYVRTLSKASSSSGGSSSRNSGNVENKTAQTLAVPPVLALAGAQSRYTVKRELGAGTFAPVYLVENAAAKEAEADDDEDEDGDGPGALRQPTSSRLGKFAYRKPLEAIKMEEPPSTWEFYMLRQAHRRLGARAADSIVRAHEMHVFRDECFLGEEYRAQGTLLDLVNLARQESSFGGVGGGGGGAGPGSGGMDEMVAMFFTVELLRVTEALHAQQLLHGDLKGDNVLVRLEDAGPETDWSATYFGSGAHGWASKGISLIDFGRGIDMRHFGPGVAFIADWKTSEADCAEMRELRPWTYQIDYHGLAGIVHSMLFGKYMESPVAEKGAGLGHGATKTYRIRESFKRYWQTEIWTELFHLLLNPLAHVDVEEGKKMPVVRGMRACRERMENWLEENCERGVGLKGMISRMQVAIRERRRKSAKSVHNQ